MVQWFRTLTALPEDRGLRPSTPWQLTQMKKGGWGETECTGACVAAQLLCRVKALE